MASNDLGRVKRNVAKMVEQGAPEGDIDAYISGEGTTVEAIRAFKEQTAQKSAYDAVATSMPVRALGGVALGAVKAGVGAIQGGAQLIGAEDTAKAAGQVTKNLNSAINNAGTAGKVGGFVGEYGPYMAAPTGAATLGGRMVLGAAGGAAQGMMQAQETPDMGKRLGTAAVQGAVGAALPAATNVIGKGVGQFAKGYSNPAAVKAMEAVPRAADDYKEIANGLYEVAEKKGGVLKPVITNDFISRAQQVLPQTKAGQLVAGESPTSQLISRIGQLKDSGLTLKAAQEIDEYLGDVAYGMVDNKGLITKEGTKLLKLQNALRESIDKASPAQIVGGKEGYDALSAARGSWRTAMQLKDVERIIQRAEMTDNPVTAIKTGFRNLAMSGRIRDPQLLKAVQRAAKTGIATEVLRGAGSRLTQYVAAGVGGGVGGIPGGIAAGVGANLVSGAARKGAEALQKGRAEKVVDAIVGPRAAPLEKAGAAVREGVESYKRSPLSKTDGFITNPIGKLPMDKASQMQRARDMGFDVDNQLFRGVARQADIVPSNDTKRAANNKFGDVIYTTTDKKAASDIALMRRSIPDATPLTAQLVARGKLVKLDGWFPRGEVADLMKLAGIEPDRVSNILKEHKGREISGQSLYNLLQKGFKPNKSAEGWADTYPNDAKNYANSVLQKAGYDGIQFLSERNYFDPKNIRSVNAAFDPAKKNSADILASRPEAGIAAVGLGLGGANFASSLATNTSNNPSQPIENRNATNAVDLAAQMDAAEAPKRETPKPVEKPKRTSGLSENFMDKLIFKESSGNPNAKAKTSSAVGLTQMTEGTWMALMKKHHPDMVKGKTTKQVLAMRTNAKLSVEMAHKLAEENVAALKKAGLPVTDTTAYLAHFLGPTGAKKILTARVGTPVSQVLTPDQIKRNRSVLAGKNAEDVLYWAKTAMKE